MSRPVLTSVKYRTLPAAVTVVVIMGLFATADALVSAIEKTALSDFRAATGNASALASWASGDPCTNAWTASQSRQGLDKTR